MGEPTPKDTSLYIGYKKYIWSISSDVLCYKDYNLHLIPSLYNAFCSTMKYKVQ